MGSVTLSCACINGFCLFLCFCRKQLILLSAHLINLLLVSYSPAPSSWACVVSTLHHWSVSSWYPPDCHLGFWGYLEDCIRWNGKAAKGTACQQLTSHSPQHTMWNRAVSQAGKGIPIEANQPTITLWQLIGEKHGTDTQLWKVTQTKIPCSYFLWHNLRKERRSRVSPSQLRESFQEGSMSSVFGKHGDLFLFFTCTKP